MQSSDKAVIFDIDGTIIDSFESNYEMFVLLMEAAGYTPPTKEFARLQTHLTFYDSIALYAGSDDPQEIDRVQQLYWDEVRTRRSVESCFAEHVKDVIERLSHDFLLGIVTNRIMGDKWMHPLDQIQPFFNVCVGYEDTEVHKPDPAPLLRATEQLDVEPSNCVYIGDSSTDMQAANAASMKAIYYGDEYQNVDLVSRDWLEIEQWLKTL